MNKRFIEIDGLTISAFETEPIKGYEAPTNKETGEQFPNCCFFHKRVFEISEKWLLKSSNYCNNKDVAVKIVKQLSYTQHHIKERKNIDDWYNDITNYIEYNIDSFGHPATGLHLYLDFLKQWIEHKQSEIPKIKKQSLIEFIENCLNPIDIDKIPMTDFNMLLDTYNKWFKIFPFEISFFATLKPHFENLRPIFNGKKHNPYSKTYTFKAHTKGSLIDVLLNLTNNLLTQINTTTLYEKGLLTEPQKIKLELVLNERKMKLKQGYVNSSKDEEQRYRKILKEWFADEKRFIDEVTPIVKALPPQPINNETDTEKYTAKHYLLAYLFECNAKGESFPIGNKKELERIGNERMGAGKGNRFYKLFNEVINKDLNVEKNLIEIGDEYWRKAVIELSKAPELVEKYLQSKQL
jgi:hypothetical protein